MNKRKKVAWRKQRIKRKKLKLKAKQQKAQPPARTRGASRPTAPEG